jgi:hypothetical protein
MIIADVSLATLPQPTAMQCGITAGAPSNAEGRFRPVDHWLIRELKNDILSEPVFGK